MPFNSYLFIFLFLPLVLAGYYGLNHWKLHKTATVFLIGMSCWFYGYSSVGYLVVLIISILMNYLLVRIMGYANKKGTRQCLLVIGILLNLGSLFYYKYLDFFIENINTVWKTDISLLRIAMPLGISFYTFQQLAYVIDSYKGECESYTLLEYMAYAVFFPKMIQGPIALHREVIPQMRMEENKQLQYMNLSKGIYAFSLGMAKKVLIADTLAKLVNIGYDNIPELSVISTVIVMFSYSLQIYFDFSGYTDMAYGLGYMFNIELPWNFNSPYKADSISDFWDRWHMTLTRFFTRYLYIPLGGSRRGAVRTYVNIMIVFLVSGFWHGANWTFILWGAMHGIAKVIDRLFGKRIDKIPRWIRMVSTFLFTTFAWSLFRADSISQAKHLWRHLRPEEWGGIYTGLTETFNDLLEVKVLYRVGLGGLMNACPWCIMVVFLLILVIACFTMRNTQEKVTQMQLTKRRMLVTVILLMWCMVSLTEVSVFLYANF